MTEVSTAHPAGPLRTGSMALQIAVGPPHPHADDAGTAGHAAVLAHHRKDAGHDLTLVRWHGAGPDSRVRAGRRSCGAAHVLVGPAGVRGIQARTTDAAYGLLRRTLRRR